ncbi:MAG: hypothetical protein H6726_17755 [Sandaracinaceae bacterium]|nr:hypothetical protein [Sandaracinaceae bacterium]
MRLTPGAASAAWALLCLGACTEPLGPCDELAALRVVYDEEGTPAFEGQALMVQSCGFGAFCHAGEVEPARRLGAPHGLDYDLRIVNVDDDDAHVAAGFARLVTMWNRAFRHRHAIWTAVDRGRMPVGGGAGADVQSAAPVYSGRVSATRLEPIAGLDTSSGRSALRNWLACGLPVVQSTDAHAAHPEAFGHIVDPIEIAPVEPRWSSIYDGLLRRRCASAPCHGVAVAGDLDLRGPRDAYDALVGVASVDEACASEGLMLVAPGAADDSLLVWKLLGRDADGAAVCGDPMPEGGSRVSEASVDAIRAWIDAGAVFDAPPTGP